MIFFEKQVERQKRGKRRASKAGEGEAIKSKVTTQTAGSDREDQTESFQGRRP